VEQTEMITHRKEERILLGSHLLVMLLELYQNSFDFCTAQWGKWQAGCPGTRIFHLYNCFQIWAGI